MQDCGKQPCNAILPWQPYQDGSWGVFSVRHPSSCRVEKVVWQILSCCLIHRTLLCDRTHHWPKHLSPARYTGWPAARGAGGMAPFALASFAAGVAGWLVGGHYTLVALTWLGVPLDVTLAGQWHGAASLAWLIPLGVSALEVGFSRPYRRHGWPVALFVLVVLLDCGSTALGMYQRFAGAVVAGVTFAAGSPQLATTAILAALVLTFLPEVVVIGALAHVKAIVWG